MTAPFDFSAANLDREFPVRLNLVYFNHAAVAPLPRRVAEAIVAHVENARDRGAADWRKWYGMIERTREKAAAFLGAARSEISFLPSTSWALNLVARSFDWKPGDNVVGDDMEFPSNFYPWQLLARQGVEHRLARNRDGRITRDDIARMVDSRTRLVAVSWVAFHNGFVYPIREIGEFCRERGILLVVDAIQGLGAIPFDASKMMVDVFAADAHKWLLGPETCTLFYVGENARDRLPPPFAGWWNIRSQEDEAGFLDYGGNFHAGGRRYEPGSLPTAQLAGLEASVDFLQEMSVPTVHDRILELVGALQAGLEARGWRIASPQPLASGILAAVPPSLSARAAAKALESRGVIVAPREGAVRFSPHAGNDHAEVERALAAIDEIG
ncbi:MAG TPA: aminotransferase class V-fold PLP-dependent enzyme [Thermoanaerobaculia bacterium]|nr:aminotransferase class V-fold PLP-dependent enzyme [Thermoanaerobaculia bacterium]